MSKVVFEFDTKKDKDIINIILNKENIIETLININNFRLDLLSSKIDKAELIIIRNNKIISNYSRRINYNDEDKEYISKDFLELKLRNLLKEIPRYNRILIERCDIL